MIKPKPSPWVKQPRRIAPPQQRVMLNTIAQDHGNPGRNILIVAAVLLIAGGWACLKGAESLTWPQTGGRIVVPTTSTTMGHRRQDGHSTDERRAIETGDIRYAYTVKGRDYVGTAIQPFDFGTQDWLVSYKRDDLYREHTVVRVSYDPGDPSVAYLEPGPSGAALILFGIGILVGLGGLWARHAASRAPRTFA